MPPRIPSQRTLRFIAFNASPFVTASSSRHTVRTLVTQAPSCLRERRSKLLESPVVDQVKRIASKDPYQVLGVAKDATLADIKKVYYSLARKYHPDTNKDKGAQEKFVEIQAAYDILSDEKKRKAYDKYGEASQQPGFDPDAFANARGPFGGGGFSGFEDLASFFGGKAGRGSSNMGHDVFETLFGAASRGRGRGGRGTGDFRGDDLEAHVTLSFLDAAKGTKTTVNINPVSSCSSCSGTGLKPGMKRQTCTSCNGTGTRTFVIDSGFQMASTCNTCAGAGTTIPRGGQCSQCAGDGFVRLRKNISVDIPAGVEDGMTIRVPGEGDVPVSSKGPKGDLLLRVSVAPSKVFRRQGTNIHHEARIPMHTALLGGRVRVPTLDGDVDVRVPGGTQPGEEMVLKGRGLPAIFGGDRGDLFISFIVQLPRSLTKRQRELLQLYADDVEGRISPSNAQGDSKHGSKRVAEGQGGEEPVSDTNGTDSFTNSSSSSKEGWTSRAWRKFRTHTGF
ncbi:hypothetical protein SCHPADRAFT_912087 [Schizopora paradoxa]|uniref:DnaJ homolog 1, mitochondrial n=1 Tax=Schizopora paradoxa TaxID=27342 RepID=A0A0H2S889_9AGAM|nr:hypothetical protein SCHPADRAFT_912087 [Schizopora paradoxa]